MELGYPNMTFLTTAYGTTGAIAGAVAYAGIDDTTVVTALMASE